VVVLGQAEAYSPGSFKEQCGEIDPENRNYLESQKGLLTRDPKNG